MSSVTGSGVRWPLFIGSREEVVPVNDGEKLQQGYRHPHSPFLVSKASASPRADVLVQTSSVSHCSGSSSSVDSFSTSGLRPPISIIPGT